MSMSCFMASWQIWMPKLFVNSSSYSMTVFSSRLLSLLKGDLVEELSAKKGCCCESMMAYKKSDSFVIIPRVSLEQRRNKLRYLSGVFPRLECIQRNSLFSLNPQEHESILGSVDATRRPHLSPEHQNRIGRHPRS